LLSHTGGTGDIFGPKFETHRLELKTLQDYVDLYGERDLQFEPGTRWEYSNYGFLLLGVLIEKVSGKSYYDFVAENIYQVAGMTNSGSEPESVAVTNRSKGYMRDQFEMVSNEPTLPWRGTSAGGGYTTAADLMKFAGALMSNKLLKAETLAEATRPQFTTGAYGFGFQFGRPDEARTYGHGGGAPGMNAILRVYPESGQRGSCCATWTVLRLRVWEIGSTLACHSGRGSLGEQDRGTEPLARSRQPARTKSSLRNAPVRKIN